MEPPKRDRRRAGVFTRVQFSFSKLCCSVALLLMLEASESAMAQNITFFFSAGDLGGEADRFGNTYTVGPEDAIDPRPFGNEDLQDVFLMKMTSG
jgi:hypothetical protein